MEVTFRDGRSKGAAMTSQVFPREEYEARWAKVQSEMARRGYETAVIWSRGASSYDRCANLLWLVNHYSGHPGQTPDNNLWQGRGPQRRDHACGPGAGAAQRRAAGAGGLARDR